MGSPQDGRAPIELEIFLNGKASWLRAAARGLVENRRMPTDTEIGALADHCLLEASKQLAQTEPPLDPGAIAGTPSRAGLRLERVFDVRGVNALGDRAKLELADADLAIVYGPNGSGKSGYARLMKHLCGARLAGTIHGNVFDLTPESPSANIEVRALETHGPATDTTILSWDSARGPLGPLKAVPVFDSATSLEFGDSASAATHTPRSMQFVGRLIQISDQVAANLRQRADLLVTQMPVLPSDLTQSPAANELRQLLRSKTQGVAIEEVCILSDEGRAERVTLEAALAQANPAELHAKVVAELERLAKHKAAAVDREHATGEEKAGEIVAAQLDALNKRAAATAHATSFFQGLPLAGVGEDTWRRMWAAAEAYAQAFAYPDHTHPNTEEGARCVLCQQLLNGDAKARMQGFADFIQDRLQAEATAAELRAVMLVQALPGIPDAQTWSTVSQAVGLDHQTSEALRLAIAARSSALKVAVDVASLPVVDWAEWHAAQASRTVELEKQRDTLAGLIDVEGRKLNQARLLELRGREWLAAHREHVSAEAERLRAIEGVEAAIRLTSTNALTTKNNEIAGAELAKGFCDRFNAEMWRLGGRGLPVVMTHQSKGKGRFTFCAELRDPQRAIHNREVLSEGEQRVVALAAFLADATGSDRCLPIVFDDPISSLDQRFEEAVADRIAELAETRQVLVLTHRLSLMVLLKNAVKKRAEFHGSTARVQVLSIARDGRAAGVPATIDAFAMKPKEGLDKVVRDARSAANFDGEIRRAVLRNACSNFRILVERSVEEHLLFGMVMRYRREIKTMGHLKKLTAIRIEDCELIDGMMSKYSAFEHSQPMETPAWLPEIEELIADASSVQAWIKPFEARAKAAAEGRSSIT